MIDRNPSVINNFSCFISLFPLIKNFFFCINNFYFTLFEFEKNNNIRKQRINKKKMKSINEFITQKNRGLSKIKWRYWWGGISFHTNRHNNNSKIFINFLHWLFRYTLKEYTSIQTISFTHSLCYLGAVLYYVSNKLNNKSISQKVSVYTYIYL